MQLKLEHFLKIRKIQLSSKMDFYTICFVELAILLLLTVYYSYHWAIPMEDGVCFEPGSGELLWRIVATSVSVPLLIEYILDLVVTYNYPLQGGTRVIEDRLGHGLIIASLLPISYVPLWLFGSHGCANRDGFVSFGHAMIVCGVLGKLETFSSDVWDRSQAILIMTLFLSAQCSLLFGIHIENDFVSYKLSSLRLGSALKLLSAVVFLTSSRNIQIVFRELKKESSNFLTTRKFLCTTLFIGLALFLLVCTYFCSCALWQWPGHKEIISQRIIVQVVTVMVTAVLPGRIMRRGIHAAEQTIQIQREMSYKKTFVRYISHEVRSPLSTTAIGLDCLIDLLQGPKRLSRAELLDLAKDAKITCQSAIQTLNDLLLFDKIESNLLSLEKTKVNCTQFLTNCIKPFVRQLKIAGLVFRSDFEPRLEKMVLNIDQMKCEQVLRNFLGNAVKFTSVGGEICVVAMLVENDFHSDVDNKAKTSNKMVRVEVRDTGAGISQENQERLFQQYVQFDANRLQGGKGSGLGLWISKAIIDSHNGNVGVYSAGVGHGSTFYFTLPCYDSDDAIPSSPRAVQEREDISDLASSTSMPSMSTGSSNGRGAVKYRNEHIANVREVNNSHNLRQRGMERAPLAHHDHGSSSASSIAAPLSANNISSLRSSNRLSSVPPPEHALSTASASSQDSHELDCSQVPKLRILIADDAALARKMVERVLVPITAQCVHATNGLEAVQKVKESLQKGNQKFDVVIMDFYMPGLDGPEAIAAMRQLGYTGLIFGVTASAAHTDLTALSSSGADVLMTKPFQVKVFLDHLKHLLL